MLARGFSLRMRNRLWPIRSGLLLAQINGGNHAGLMTQLRELVSRFTGLQYALCQCHGFFGVAFVKVGFGNGRNQGQMGGIAVGGHIEITLQRGFAGAADTPEKVKFIRGRAPNPRCIGC